MKRPDPFVLYGGSPHPLQRSSAPPHVPLLAGALSFCAVCSDDLKPGSRCTTLTTREIRTMPEEALLRAAACPLDIGDELLRRQTSAVYPNGDMPALAPTTAPRRRRFHFLWHRTKGNHDE